MLKSLQRFFAGFLFGYFFISICSVLAAEGQYSSQPQGYVNDYAQIISPSDQSAINRLLRELEQKTTAEVAVVTVLSTQPETIEGYSVKLFEKWGIGKKGKDNGVLFLIASQDRRVRIETGYGLEGALPDVLCHKIINNLVGPVFKSGEYSKGITSGVQAIVGLVAKEYNVKITGQEEQVYDSSSSDSGIFGLIVLIFIVVFLFNGFWWFLPGRNWYGTGGTRGWSGGGFSGGGGGFGGGGASGRW